MIKSLHEKDTIIAVLQAAAIIFSTHVDRNVDEDKALKASVDIAFRLYHSVTYEVQK